MSGGSIRNIPYFLSDDIREEVEVYFGETDDTEHQEEVTMYVNKLADDIDALTDLVKSLDYFISGDHSVEKFLEAARERYGS